jgi:hypothetical protein
MEYMILIHVEEMTQSPAPGTPEFDERMGGWMAYNQMLMDGGHFVAGASLMPVSTATTVRSTLAGAPSITDGPYAETKEQLGGFYLVEATDLDQALALAAQVPVPATLEVRPIMFRPDAPR